MTEIWDIVDENGKSLGMTWERSRHREIPEGLYHPCVEVWVRVGDRLLITQRHPDKSEGLKYDIPGGAVVSGEGVLIGAVRELAEEVGIEVLESDLLCLGSMTNGSVLATSYLLKLESLPMLTLQPTEVVGYKFVTRDELFEMTDSITKGTLRRLLMYADRVFE